MKEIIVDTLLDAIKLIPFLFIAFLIMEIIEHKFSKKNKNKIEKAGKLGPLFGGLLGVIPQCGFSVMATNLYATRIITIGTLISIYLSTSDEMLPILLSHKTNLGVIAKILFIKILIGIIFGFIIDLVFRKNKKNKDYEIKEFCLEENCDCNHGVLKSSIKHTLSIIIFIMVITFILNFIMHYFGEEKLSILFLKYSFLSPFISSLIGLIPNCGASVVLTELYLNEIINFSSLISGLLTGAGVAILVLFKVNKNKKENIKIILTLYLIGSLCGILLEIIKIIL